MSKVNLRTLGRNTLVAGLAEVWRVVSRFVLTPLIIGILGLEGYGVWTLVFSVAAYVSMANASFGLAYTKFTAECMQAEEYDRLSRIVGSGMVGIGSVALVGLGAAAIFGESIMRAFNTPEAMVGDAATALMIVLVVLVLRMSIGCCHEVLSGLHRMDLTSRLAIIASIIEFCVSVPLLLSGWGLVGLALGHLAGYGSNNFMAYWLVRKHAPQLRISPFMMSREGFRLMLRTGGKFQLLMGVNTLVMHGAKFIISRQLGPAAVGIYNLADRLLELGRAASAAVVGPLMPAFADTQARGDAKTERVLLLKGSKADGLTGGGVLAFLAVFAPYVVFIWTGEHFTDASWALQVMVVGDGMFVLTSVISSNLRARGKVRLEMTTALISGTIGIGSMFPLMALWGFQGAIIARLMAQVIAASWYTLAFLRSANIPLREYIDGVRIGWIVVSLGLASAAAGVGVRLLPIPDVGLPERWHAVVEVAAWGCVFGAIAVTAAWHLVVDDAERERLRGIGHKIRRKLGRG
ncbi:MAG: oligosaccharide flippase family protein [Nannocystaceae bacterium]|nr:oligosaccharide flippase family protein [Nannocystaceae bacterium]